VAVRKSLPVNLAFIAVMKVVRQFFQQPDLFAFFHLIKQFGLRGKSQILKGQTQSDLLGWTFAA
jgi:hypothetical protein